MIDGAEINCKDLKKLKMFRSDKERKSVYF